MWNNWWFWFKPEAFFEGYPHTRLPHVMIWYYYVQFAFWLQQIFVLYVEVPRKDFWAMIAHHTVTLLLIGGSALSNFWLAGNAVFVVMDLADIILAVRFMKANAYFFLVFFFLDENSSYLTTGFYFLVVFSCSSQSRSSIWEWRARCATDSLPALW